MMGLYLDAAPTLMAALVRISVAMNNTDKVKAYDAIDKILNEDKVRNKLLPLLKDVIKAYDQQA
jgi:hypothetical protein